MTDSRGLRLLREARRLVAESWCRGADARNAGGGPVEPWDEAAVSWSLLGAIVAVLERQASEEQGEVPLGELATALYAIAELVDTDSLKAWNDDPRRTQGIVVSVLDRAAANYEAARPEVHVSFN
jgi:hypothetical protein